MWEVTYKECRAAGDVQSAMFSLPMCTIGHVRMCVIYDCFAGFVKSAGFFLFRVHITEKFLFRGKQIQKSRKRADSAIRLVGAFSEICT